MGISRRSLIGGGASTAALALIGPAGRAEAMLGRIFDWLNSRPVESPLPGESILDFSARVLPEITPTGKFYVQSIGWTPAGGTRVDWKISVGGSVNSPFELIASDLTALPQREAWAAITCIGNPVGGGQIGNALWRGVPLRALLERASPRESALRSPAWRAVFRAADGYHDSIPLEAALDERTLLCHRMNGAPLPPDHGAPLRLLTPGVYGLKNVKWIRSTEVAAGGHAGYWQGRGWSDAARVETLSRFEAPRRRVTVGAPSAWLVGSAFAGDRGISRVEVAYGLGPKRHPWAPALVKKPLGSLAWTPWAFRMEFPEDGFYPATVRAVDGAGQLQTEKISGPKPGGATGLMELNLYATGLPAM